MRASICPSKVESSGLGIWQAGVKRQGAAQQETPTPARARKSPYPSTHSAARPAPLGGLAVVQSVYVPCCTPRSRLGERRRRTRKQVKQDRGQGQSMGSAIFSGGRTSRECRLTPKHKCRNSYGERPGPRRIGGPASRFHQGQEVARRPSSTGGPAPAGRESRREREEGREWSTGRTRGGSRGGGERASGEKVKLQRVRERENAREEELFSSSSSRKEKQARQEPTASGCMAPIKHGVGGLTMDAFAHSYHSVEI